MTLTSLLKRLWPFILLLSLVSIWELLYRLGFASPRRISYPIAVLWGIFNFEFMSRFFLMIVQVVTIALIGGGVGLMTAIYISGAWFSQSIVRFLRFFEWFPLFFLCTFPIWPVSSLLFIPGIGAIAASLYACRHSLSVHLTTQQRWLPVLPVVGRLVVLRALLFAVYAQFYFESAWIVLCIDKPEVGYLALTFTGGILLLIARMFRSDFGQAAEFDCGIELAALKQEKSSDFRVIPVVFVLCFVTLYVLGQLINTDFRVGTPTELFETVSRLVIEEELLLHIAISLVEIVSGLAIALVVGLFICAILAKNSNSQNLMRWFLFLMYTAPFFLVFSVSNWLDARFEVWQTMFGVALLTLFPLTKALWGIRHVSMVTRVALGTAEALPFAFVGMIMGEMWVASKGLGFVATLARAGLRINEAFVVSLLTFTLFLLLLSSLRLAAKQGLKTAD